MKQIKAILFDFDGVIADTEPQYDELMNRLGEEYELGISDFASKVKGTPTPTIVKQYFSHLSKEDLATLENKLYGYERTMDFPPIKGALGFIDYLKENNYKLALVTSSQQVKMTRALRILNLTNIFDCEVTADRITHGKPHPMCFQLAAKDLNLTPDECIVFEDSLHGVNAGLSAGMRVIGVTTSFPKEKMDERVYAHISDFENIEEVVKLLR